MMRFLKFLLIIFFFSACAPTGKNSQKSSDNIPSKAQKWYKEARQYLSSPHHKTYDKAITLLQKAVTEAPQYFEANALLASLYNREKAYDRAVKYFDRANEIDSDKLASGYDIYAHAEAGRGSFSKALQRLHRYLQKKHLSDRQRQRALKWESHFAFGLQSKQQHHPFRPVNLGDSINTSDPEYLPSMTIDGRKLIFTRKVHNLREDFFISEKGKNRKDGWTKAVPFRAIFFKDKRFGSVHYNKGSEAISQDGKLFFFTICDREDGLGSCDIYYTRKTSSGWSRPKNIGSPVNSPYWDTQPCLSPDGTELYFVSNRPGGRGGSDIYVSHLHSDGHWGKPVNLGENINTSGEESSPFIHADNKTLYFASDGHQGIGGVDLFYIRKKIDGSWGKAHNLGYPINTIDHDGSIFVKADGKTAFFASDRKDSRGMLDIYKFQLYPQARPVKTLYIQGAVFDKKTGKNVVADIVLADLESEKILTTIKSDQEGHYLVTLPVGRSYAFHVRKKGYLFYSAHFSLQDSIKWRPYQIDIPLQPLEKKAHTILENVFFDFDKYTLRQESFMELNAVLALLKKNPALKIQINGYTDSTGTKSHNMKLSQNRAEAVVNYLTKHGIEKNRLKAKGFGAKKPVATNDTEEGRAKNRRTEMEVIGR